MIPFLASQAPLGRYGQRFLLSDPTGWRVALGTGVYLTLMALLGSAPGWVTRSTPGGISAFVGVSLLLPVLFGQVLGTWGKDLARYLPGGTPELSVTQAAR